jgi:hypothetical protein
MIVPSTTKTVEDSTHPNGSRTCGLRRSIHSFQPASAYSRTVGAPIYNSTTHHWREHQCLLSAVHKP